MPSAVGSEELELDTDSTWRIDGTAARDACVDEVLGAGMEPGEGSPATLSWRAESGKGLVVEGTSDSDSAFSRRRILGGGTSGSSDGRGGPFINAATVFDAES